MPNARHTTCAHAFARVRIGTVALDAICVHTMRAVTFTDAEAGAPAMSAVIASLRNDFV